MAFKQADTERASPEERAELDARCKRGETVISGGTGGKSLEAQEHLAEGRTRGGMRRKDQLGTAGYKKMGARGGQTRKEQIGIEGYREMGRKGGLSTPNKSGGETGIQIDESKFKSFSD